MKVRLLVQLVCTLLVGASSGSRTGQLQKACRPGFSQNFYTVIVSRDKLHGQSILKVKFEDCQRSREVGFVSSDPKFSVRPDGTVYAEQEVANLSEPVQFMLTARGLHDPHIWETTVKLALAGHLHPLPLTKISFEEMLSRVWDPQPRVIKFSRRHQRGSSANGLRRQKRDWVIPPINVPENSRGPFPHMLVRIRSDQDKNDGIRYSITGAGADQPPSGIYNIDPISGNMFVTQPLDREEKASFHLRAHAVDMNGNQVENPVDLYIYVIDMNDNRPEFQNQVYNGSVAEGSKPGSSVMQVTATDSDDSTTANGMVRYRILSQIPETPISNMFTINSETGDIVTVAAGLDREVSAPWVFMTLSPCCLLKLLQRSSRFRSCRYRSEIIAFQHDL
nr:cadherin-4 isoform X2 [Nothobranchius furzeri]